MLYAELHGKLDSSASDLERREDILTSTVFGTLLVAGASEVLVNWFNSARLLGPSDRLVLHGPSPGLPVQEPESWFWPSLSYAQPDIILRIGSHLLVVEAKYGSALSPTRLDQNTVETVVTNANQLLRQWRSMQRDARDFDWYPSDIRSAIESCDVKMVYLVSTRSQSTAMRELSESRAKIRDAAGCDVPMWLLTWQDLHRTLINLVGSQLSPRPWMEELILLLERRHLAAFLGFPRTLAGLDQHRLEQLDLSATEFEGWAAGLKNVATDYFGAVSRLDFDAIGRVAQHWPEVCEFCQSVELARSK